MAPELAAVLQPVALEVADVLGPVATELATGDFALAKVLPILAPFLPELLTVAAALLAELATVFPTLLAELLPIIPTLRPGLAPLLPRLALAAQGLAHAFAHNRLRDLAARLEAAVARLAALRERRRGQRGRCEQRSDHLTHVRLLIPPQAMRRGSWT
jgi:hypothetical protein